MVLGTKKLQYLDLTILSCRNKFLEGFYKAYDVKSPKGFFPYEWFDSLDKLDYPGLPPREACEKYVKRFSRNKTWIHFVIMYVTIITMTS